MVGRTLGRYRVLEQVGAGGMGTVYRARDERLHRDVAVKVLTPGTISGPAARKRFRQEALALSALNHPNIATIYDFDSEGELDFLVMEYISGVTLDERLTRGRLAEKEVIDFGAQLAGALQEAHEKRVVHRDLKPGNIMLTSRGQVKVLDFGLARLRPPDTDTATTRSSSETHGAVGTLPYMAPEQLGGGPVDARTDIHALGAVLYEMSSGRRPFTASTAHLLADAILHQPPAPPRAANPALSSLLENIILKCLEKDPEHRYQSARDLLGDLRRAGAAPSASAHGTRSAFGLRRAAWWTKAGILSISLVASIAGAWWYLGRPPSLTEKDIVLLAGFENRTGDAVFDGRLLEDALAYKILESPFLNVYPAAEVRTTLRLMKRPEDSPIDEALGRELCVRLGLRALVAGSIARLGRTYVLQVKAIDAQSGATLAIEQAEAGSKEDVVRQIGKAAADLRNSLGEMLASGQRFDVPLEQVTTSSLDALRALSMGRTLSAQGRFTEALVQYRRATEIDPEFAVAFARLADAYGNDNQMGLMREAATKAFALRKRTSERERLSIEFTYYASVVEDVRRTVEVAEVRAQLFPKDGDARNDLGVYYRTLGRFQEAIEQFQESLSLSPRAAGRAYGNLAWTYQFMGRTEQAETLGEQALAAGYDSVGVRQLLFVIAAVRGDTGAAQAQTRELVGKPQEYLAAHWRGDRAASLGRIAEAREHFSTAARLADARGLVNRVAMERAWVLALDADVGRCGDVADGVDPILALSREVNVLRDAAHALALCGATGRAEVLIRDLVKSRPHSTYVNELLQPALLALVQVHRGRADAALDLLSPLEPYDRTQFGMRAMYLRGLAHLSKGSVDAAAAQFQAILDNRGLDALSVRYPLARLQLARAAALSGNPRAAVRHFEAFFELWKAADPDLPVVTTARAEYARLRAGAAPR